MIDPYVTPDSDVENFSVVREVSLPKIIVLIVFCSMAIEVTSWLAVPKLNAFFADVLSFTGLEYWTIRLSFDLLNSLLVYCAFVPVFARYSGLNGYIVSFLCALNGFVIFYIELGGFECLGNCGLPLWYDLSGFIKHFVFALVSGAVANKLNNQRSRSESSPLIR